MAEIHRIGGGIVRPSVQPPVQSALEELHALLRDVAGSSTPHRSAAVRYTTCRSVLLDSELRPLLPGFLVQCVSIARFHEFINLYHYRHEARIGFVETEMKPLTGGSDDKPAPSIFGESEF